MTDIKIIRVDFRLIHGQVIAKWLKQTTANKILVVDDELSKDSFMSQIYVMAAPVGIEVIVDSVSDAINNLQKNKYEDGRLFVLFKNIESIYRAFKNGFPIKEVQIGGLGAGPKTKLVYGPIAMNEEDVKMLKEMHDLGVHIYLHQVPDDPSMEFSKILEKKIFNI